MRGTISNLAAAHLAWMALRRSPATVQFYRYAYRRLERFLAGRPEQTLAQWSPLLADQYGKHLVEDGVRPTTVKHYVNALRTLARWSVEEGYLKRNPPGELRPAGGRGARSRSPSPGPTTPATPRPTPSRSRKQPSVRQASD